MQPDHPSTTEVRTKASRTDHRSAQADRLGAFARCFVPEAVSHAADHWRLPVAVFFACGLATPAMAIPSPDVVVTIFSNAAQIFGLLTLAVGGALFSRRRAARRRGRSAAAGSLGTGVSRKLLVIVGLVVGASVIANAFQWADAVDLKNTRLQANLLRSSTEAGKTVGDVSLKTLSFSAQVSHPLGISTAELNNLREPSASKTDPEETEIAFIDVREPEELETGNLEGFSHIRYPELFAQAEALKLAGKKTVLLCHSGNRSSELCIALNELGIDCRFVIGGYEKWLAEGRASRLSENATPKSLRSLPQFPNGDVLLDTPEVQRLVSEEQAVFVDVRYPEDFGNRHLPDAINLPIRKMTSGAIDDAFGQLPARPVVAPCYDKRSCFYAQILGLRLHRQGFDFRGRYTVPDEFFNASDAKPHVKQWLDAQDGSVFAVIRRPYDSALSLVLHRTGNLVLAIFLVLVALRLLLLPFTAKNERDQIVERRISDRVSDLKQRLMDDPQRLKGAIRTLYRENGLTPGRNVFGLILQIVLLVAFFSAISAVATPNSGAFLWVPDIGMPDPYFLLPVLVGAFVFLQLQLFAVRRSTKFLMLRILAGVFFIALTVALKAALTLYLIFGLALMLLQTLAVRFLVNRAQPTLPGSGKPLTAQIARLNVAHRMAGVGTKAQRIALMMAAGMPVPRGLIIPDAMFLRSQDGAALSDTLRRQLLRRCKRLGLRRMAVRSSGLGEDGADRSYAGVFESILDVDRDGLFDAVGAVRRSLLLNGTSVYGDNGSIGGGVIVQDFMDADYAGVLFTEHPMQSGAMLVEMAAGLGDKIANGEVEPERYVFGRWSREALSQDEPPIDLAPLIELGLRAQQLFGQPQDIEWAYANGRFYLLQSRNITVLSRSQTDGATQGALEQAAFEKERNRVLQIVGANGGNGAKGADETVLIQNEVSELLPRPTPLSLSLMEAHWKPGGSVDLACRALGVPYAVEEEAPAYVVSTFGGLYVNAQERSRRSRKSLGPVASFRLSRAAGKLEQEFLEQFLPGYLTDLRLLDSMDFARVGTGDLVNLLEDVWDRYCHESHVQVDIVNIAADFYLQAAKRELGKRNLPASAYLGQCTKTIVHHAIMLLQGMRSGTNMPEEFLALFGHRSDVDYELANPRYRENVAMIEQLLRSASSMTTLNHAEKRPPDLSKDGTLAIAVKRARTFQNLKEVAKHYALRELAVMRRMLVELDRRFDLDGGIFYLEFEELFERCQANDHEAFASIIEERRAAAEFFDTLPPLPTNLSLREIERLTPTGSADEQVERSDEMHGILVAGDGAVVGRARVLTDQDIQTVEDGEIVVARYMHPSWTPIFPRLGGIVTEVGGWLSHTSILAREYNITTIIGVKGAEYQVQTGDLLKLNVDGTIEVIERSTEEIEGPTVAKSQPEDAAVVSHGAGRIHA